MPPKGKKAIQLQEVVDTQEQWDNFLARAGLAVIDVYSAWCGPCKAVMGLFRRLKNELGDDLLQMAIAKSDTIDSLEPYRESSEPTFLMFGGGELVAVVRGAMGPELERALKEQLAAERAVREGKAERKVIADEGLNRPEVLLEDDIPPEPEPEPELAPQRKEFTIVVIKPDAVQAGKADEIVEQLEATGMEVLCREERQLTREEAAEFYKQHEGSEHFEELVEFMTSGPCLTLVLTRGDTGEGVLGEIRELLGPTDVEQAREEAPQSLRAQYGTDKRMNALHASDSQETAARELAFFHPRFSVPWVPGREAPIQRTVALIRPSALAEHGEAILGKIHEAGFQIAMQKELLLSREQAADFYKEHEGRDYFDSLCANMSSGPMMALCLAREDAVEEWRRLIGPTEVEQARQEAPQSLRAQFSVPALGEGVEGAPSINSIHGSSNQEEAQGDLNFFFPVEQTVAVIKPTAMAATGEEREQKDAILEHIRQAGFSVSLSKETHLTKEMAEQLYAEHRGKEFFGDLTDLMSSGPSLVMVLSREDAVVGWRALMGPVDPQQAKESSPSSLRALFGQSVLDNAVHGSSTLDHAQQEIKTLLGDAMSVQDGAEGGVEGEGEVEGEEGS